MSFLGLGLSIALRQSAAGAVSWPPTIGSATRTNDWRADTGVTGTTSISGWADQGGGADNLIVNGDAAALITNAYGSKPATRWNANGTNSTMKTLPTVGANTTIAFVAKNLAGAGSLTGLCDFGSGGINIMANHSSTNTWGVYFGSVLLSSYSLNSAPLACVISCTNYNDVTLYTDTHAGERFTTGTSFSAGGLGILGYNGVIADYFNGDLLHLSVWNGAANATDAATLITAMKNLWGV